MMLCTNGVTDVTTMNNKFGVQNTKTTNGKNKIRTSQVLKVIDRSMLLGKQCSCWHAEEALRPGRGYGDPRVAVHWLFTEGGFEILERTRKFKIFKQFISNRHVENNPNELKLLSDDHSNLNLEDQLKRFALAHGVHENVAKNAINHCNTFESGCDWILTNLNATTIIEPKAKRQCHSNDYDNSQNMFGSNTTTTTTKTTVTATATAATETTHCWERQADRNQWICKCCTLINEGSSERCDACEGPSPFYKQRILRQEELSKLKVEALTAQDALEALQSEQTFRIAQKQQITVSEGLNVPYYWDPFPCGQTTLEKELITNAPLGKLAKEERDRIINIFIDGGINIHHNNVISLKRIQNLSMWQRYAAQRNIIASKPSNFGNPNVQYLFHGPRGNTEAIRKNGFIGQYGISKPYGTWTHSSSKYSGTNFADRRRNCLSGGNGGSYRIFICQAVVGTPGYDNGSGRRPNEVIPGILADCHKNGGIHVFYEDSQLYPEYLIEWK